MSLPPYAYQYVVHTIDYLFDLCGEEQLMKQIELVRHIRQRNTTSQITAIPVVEPVEEPVKNVIIQPKEPEEVTDDVYCKHMVRGGTRCAVRRKKGSNFCSRHLAPPYEH